MKKIMTVLLFMVMTVSAKAQFEANTWYASTSATGLGMSYSSNEKFSFGLEAKGGYFIAQSWMLYGTFGYDHRKHLDDFHLGVGGRYYFQENGIYMGVGMQYAHTTKNINNLHLCPEVGYAFFINRNITIEPAVYYNMSLNDFADGSKVGLKIGVGLYF